MPNSSAIVIGGSMAGLLAARVLADHVERVMIVERDQFPAGPEPRSGVPQARHLHILLARGNQILERLFPGLDAELAAAGVPRVELGYDTTGYTRSGWTPRFHSGVQTLSISRARLEWAVRSRLAANPRIAFCEGWQVTGLIPNTNHTRVTGVQMQARGGDREERALAADLVVDASGRTSRAPEWLLPFGCDAPQETVVNSFLGYATRWYKKRADYHSVWKDLLIGSIPPHIPRGGALWEIEDNQWVVTLAGANRDYPPTDEAGFMEFARSLASPVLADAIETAEPISEIYGYQRTENRMRHYERLDRWPDGFTVIGDAACGFNPVYGQGMTVAAMQAEALGECLQAGWEGVGARFQQRLAQVVRLPWLMATGEDFRYPATEGRRPGLGTHLLHRYIDRVQALMPQDVNLARTFMQVMNLTQSPATLFRPDYLLKVLKYKPK